METHTAHVFLVGSQRVYKLEREVYFPFLDLSTVEKRRIACEKEYTLNKRASPEMYLGMLAVIPQDDGSLALTHDGTKYKDVALDYVVEMVQFRQEDILSAVAERGELTPEIIDQVIDHVAEFHCDARVHTEADKGFDAMQWIAEDNAKELGEFAKRGVVSENKVLRLIEAANRLVTAGKDVLNRRAAQGKVRMCHGDLHLNNIVLVDGKPCLFDCIEFNDRLAQIDMLYDVAFLLMDLCVRDMQPLANRALNRYVARTGDVQGLQLLPLFFLCRATIRAKVACCEYEGHGAAESEDKRRRYKERAERYVDEALTVAKDDPCVGVAIGGLSGTGKSTVAAALAPRLGGRLGAVVLRSDVIRKQLAGASMLERLPEEAYSSDMSEKTYSALAQQCQATLRSGMAVIADATFTAKDNRDRIVRAFQGKDVGDDWLSANGPWPKPAASYPHFCAWLSLPYEERLTRVQRRMSHAATDSSDVTPDMLSSIPKDEPELDAQWHRLSAAAPANDIAADLDVSVRPV